MRTPCHRAPRLFRPKPVSLLLTLLLLMATGMRQAGAQSTDPAVVGQWGSLLSWPIVAVHAALLPTGKVLFYPYDDNCRIWDPATNTITTPPRPGFNIFCTGHSFLPDGRLLLTGGHVQNGWGLPDAAIYDPYANAWTHLPDMNDGRWYPTNTTLANGEVLVISGSTDTNYTNNSLPQVWTGSSWRDLSSAVLSVPLYPGMHLAPNGKVFMAIPSQTTRYLDTAGTGAWTTVGSRTAGSRSYGSSVLYADGKVLAVGGGDPPLASAEVIDLNASAPAWRTVAPMSIARRQINATLLADGKILVTGGSSAAGFDTASGAVLYAEAWDPDTEQWSRMAGYQRYRGYHSTALLLPDGRLLSAGGDGQPNAEVYSPPYLFKGARPTISSAPASVGYGQTFFVGTPEATSITKAHFIRISAVTHATNMDQRINRLTFTQASGGLNITAPSSANLCPPGHYMLFLLNGNGVPSVATIIQIGGGGTPPPPPPSTPPAPTSLTASAVSSSQINLTWADNATNEDGFQIERSLNGGTFTQIATVGAGVTSYSNTGLSGNTWYHYRVRAYNAAGSSAYSNTAKAKTKR